MVRNIIITIPLLTILIYVYLFNIQTSQTQGSQTNGRACTSSQKAPFRDPTVNEAGKTWSYSQPTRETEKIGHTEQSVTRYTALKKRAVASHGTPVPQGSKKHLYPQKSAQTKPILCDYPSRRTTASQYLLLSEALGQEEALIFDRRCRQWQAQESRKIRDIYLER